MNETKTSMQYSVKELCSLFDKSRQSFYKRLNGKSFIESFQDEVIISHVNKIRKDMPKCGGKKLYLCLKNTQPEVLHFGRDAFFNLLRGNHLLVKQKKKRITTTQSYHWLNKYDNLIKELEVDSPNQVWVSDITYIKYSDKFCYLSLITDLFTRRIMGYKVSDTLEAKHSIDALKMARKRASMCLNGLIHHSDHGIQYCCNDYIQMLNNIGAVSSMSAKGNPYENAVAERVNGIIKNEWLDDNNFRSFKQVELKVKQVIKIYNSKRIHMSLNFKTPDYVYFNFFKTN